MALLIFLFFPVLIFVLLGSSNSKTRATRSGEQGERKIQQILQNTGLCVFHNLLLHNGTRTVQIDHLAVSLYGIFVYETKNHHGFIVGDAKSKTWTQYCGQKKYEFYNPVWQNYGHLKEIEHLTGISANKIHSVVVFASDPILSISNPSGNTVLRSCDLVTHLSAYNTPVFTEEDVRMVCSVISGANRNTPELVKQHIRSVQALKMSA